MKKAKAPSNINLLLGELGYRSLSRYCAENGFNYDQVYAFLRGHSVKVPTGKGGMPLAEQLQAFTALKRPNEAKGKTLRAWLLAEYPSIKAFTDQHGLTYSNVKHILAGGYMKGYGAYDDMCRILRLDPETLEPTDGRSRKAPESVTIRVQQPDGKWAEVSGTTKEVIGRLKKLGRASP